MSTRVLAIDPGSHHTGFAILEYADRGRPKRITSGVISLEGRDLSRRLIQLFQDLSELIARYQPSELALESIFFAKNAGSALKLGHARGVVLTAGAAAHLSIFEYTPTQVKQAICGRGRADKTEISKMAKLILKLPSDFEFRLSDESDALSIGLAHAQLKSVDQRIEAAQNRSNAHDRSIDR